MDLARARELRVGKLYRMEVRGAVYLYDQFNTTRGGCFIRNDTLVIFLGFHQDQEEVIHCMVIAGEQVGWLYAESMELIPVSYQSKEP